MAADVLDDFNLWSDSEGSNLPLGNTIVGPNIDDNFRMEQAVVRKALATLDSIASAATCDLSTKKAGILTITGTTGISAFGTLTAGMRKWVVFAGALTLTHNGTSLIIPGGVNLTTAANDCACLLSLGSGNWRVLWYCKANGTSIASLTNIPDGTVAAPGLSFTSDPDTGLYRIGADSMGFSAGGVKQMEISTANGVLVPVKVAFGPTNNTFTLGATGFALNANQNSLMQVTGTSSSSLAIQCTDTTSAGQGTLSITGYGGNHISVQAGDVGGVVGTGGTTTIRSGDYGSVASGSGGPMVIRAGNTIGFGGGGALSITAGNCSASVATNARGGDVTITGGSTTYSSGAGGARGGNVVLVGGACGNEFATGVEGGVIMKPAIHSSGLQAAGAIRLQAHDSVDLLIASGQRKTVTFGGPPMTLTSGAGTGATIAGNSNVVRITFGTSATTTVVLTGLAVIGGSGNPWPNAPAVITQRMAGGITAEVATTTSTITITLSSAPSNGAVLDMHIFAFE